MADAKETIGFIGIGLMGQGMATNLLDAGYDVTILGNRNRTPVDELVARGAVEAKTAKELAERSSAVFLCLPGSPQVEETVRGEGGLAAGLKSGSVIIDCSTADPNSTIALAAEVKALGVDYVDAPLGRTPKEAWAGTLDTMVGAAPEVFARVEPMLNAWAGKVVHIGGLGDGHRMKLLNNFLSLGYAALYSEALALSNKVGISSERFNSVISGGRMDCGFYETFMGYTIGGDKDSHKFTLTNALKDLRYLEAMADAENLVNPIGNAMKNAFATAVADGGDGAENYVPHLPEYIGRLNGIDLTPAKLKKD